MTVDLPGIQTLDIPFWVVQVFIALMLTAMVSLFISHLYKRLISAAKATENLWDDALVKSTRKPCQIILWLVGAGWAMDIIWQATGTEIFSGLSRLRDVLVIVVAGAAVVRFVQLLEKNFLNPARNDQKNDPTTVVAIGRMIRFSVLITSFLIVLQALGYSISGILAFGGLGGLAMGFAAKDLLANFFGGLMIYLDKPFRVGDWIRSPDKNIEGTVEYIGWRQTRVRTFDKRPLYVPNATFTNISVENPSRMENRRIKETVGIRYQDSAQLPLILEEIREYLQNNDDIDKSKILMVHLNTFGASSLDCFIYCFTCTTDWTTYHKVKEKVLIQVMEIIHKHEADLAFPTQTLEIPDPVVIKSDV